MGHTAKYTIYQHDYIHKINNLPETTFVKIFIQNQSFRIKVKILNKAFAFSFACIIPHLCGYEPLIIDHFPQGHTINMLSWTKTIFSKRSIKTVIILLKPFKKKKFHEMHGSLLLVLISILNNQICPIISINIWYRTYINYTYSKIPYTYIHKPTQTA